MVVENFILH